MTITVQKNRRKYVKKLEHHLRNYKMYQVGLATLQKQLDYIMPNAVATYELLEGSTGTFSIRSTTETYAIDRIESKRALILHEEIAKYKMIIESIDEAVAQLDEIEKRFVELRYFEKRTVVYTAEQLGYSEKHIFDIRNQVLDKLLISLRGLIEFD